MKTLILLQYITDWHHCLNLTWKIHLKKCWFVKKCTIFSSPNSSEFTKSLRWLQPEQSSTPQPPSKSFHASCLIEHFVVCRSAQFCPLKRKNRGLSSCCLVNLALLVQSDVRGSRQWSNRRLSFFFFLSFLIPCQPFLLVIHCDTSDDDDKLRMWVFLLQIRGRACLRAPVNVDYRGGARGHVSRLIALVVELTSALTLRCKVNILVTENPSQVRPCSKVWTINFKSRIKRQGRRLSMKWTGASSVLVVLQSQMDHSVGHYFPLGPDKWVLTPFSVQISCCYHSHYYYQDQTICPATMSEKQNAPSFQTTAWLFEGTWAPTSDRVTESSTIP